MIFMNKSYILLALLLLTVLSSCMKKTVDFSVIEPVPGEGAIVYIYRPDSSSNSIISPAVLVDGKKKFEIENRTYRALNLPAGKHVFNLDLTKRYDGQHSIELILKDAKTYFLRIDTKMKFKMNDLYERRFDILNVPEDIALSEIIKCQNLDGKRSRSNFPGKRNKSQPVLTSQKAEKKETSILADDPDAAFSTSKTKNPFSRP